ncbi:MAG TPA: ThiF family adenylyltransferase [Bryobacteraceae bacterium]|jgi:molybdopterin/thiamine biosynthesis adenylyltransferase|nr:ThiF family adenylyltransferase [Bryobacteraceae bacterium]
MGDPSANESTTMIELRIQDSDVSRIVGELVGRETERCAILLASRVVLPDGLERLIVTRIEYPDNESYSNRSLVSAELKPDYIARIGKTAARESLSVVFVHSHPRSVPPGFSRTDDQGEVHLEHFLSVRAPGTKHVAVVVSEGGWRARCLGTKMPLRIISVGPQLQILFDPENAQAPASLKFDRQIRALGAAGQKHLESLTVAIVGAGGTGSIAAEQLAYLGVRKFILIDPDRIELTNLNRVVGAYASDVGRFKTDVIADMIARIVSDSVSHRIVGDVTRTRFARELRGADFIFSCTDSHGSRAVIQQIAYQYLIPCIDVGSVISASDGHIAGIHGRVQALAPGLPCFTCCELLDSEEVRRDMMNVEERQRDSYILGAYEPAPAVISINGTVSSIAMTMFLAMTVGIPSDGRNILYNARTPSLRTVSFTRNPNCYICSPQGVLGRGEAQPLFTRDD